MVVGLAFSLCIMAIAVYILRTVSGLSSCPMKFLQFAANYCDAVSAFIICRKYVTLSNEASAVVIVGFAYKELTLHFDVAHVHFQHLHDSKVS